CPAELLDLVDHDVHADTAAGVLRDIARRAEARLENQLQRFLVGEHAPRMQQAAFASPRTHRADVDAAAVVLEDDDHLGAFAMQADADRAALGLAARHALFGRLDAVHDRVAQHVLERRQHAIQHLAVQLAGGADHDEIALLAGVRRDLPHQAAEALHVALERNHARAHQAVLQFSDYARLLQQQVLRFARQILEQAFDALDVA